MLLPERTPQHARDASRDAAPRRRASEETLIAQRLIDHETRLIESGRVRDRSAAHLLRGLVSRRAFLRDGLAFVPGALRRAGRTRDPEVRQLCVLWIVDQKHVTRLHIAMDDAGTVDRFEAGEEIAAHFHRITNRQRSTLESLLERGSLDELHNVEIEAFLPGRRMVNRDDVG